MTIDEAIAHCLEVAEQKEHESFIDRWSDDDEWSESVKEECRQCATDHRQLAEWLTELKELEAKHWDECRQIAHYDNDIKSLKAQIAEFKRCVKSDNSDYLTGYISALSAVEGMIDKMIGGSKNG